MVFCKGFDPEAGFPLVLSRILGHRVLCLYLVHDSSLFCEESGRVSVRTLQSDGVVSVGSLLAIFGLFDYRARP